MSFPRELTLDPLVSSVMNKGGEDFVCSRYKECLISSTQENLGPENLNEESGGFLKPPDLLCVRCLPGQSLPSAYC